MSNRVYLRRTKFEDDGETSWGWHMGDDYHNSFHNMFSEDEVPIDIFELLAKAAYESTPEERDTFDHILENEKGMFINDSWRTFEEIAPVLRAAFGMVDIREFIEKEVKKEVKSPSQETDDLLAAVEKLKSDRLNYIDHLTSSPVDVLPADFTVDGGIVNFMLRGKKLWICFNGISIIRVQGFEECTLDLEELQDE